MEKRTDPAKGLSHLLKYRPLSGTEPYFYGDRMMMYAKFRLTKEPKPLRIDSIGTIEIEVNE